MEVLLLGDSLFARHEGQDEPHIQYSLHQLDSRLAFRNLAQSGDNSFDLIKKLDQLDWQRADKVCLWIGANDMATHKQVFLGEYLDNIDSIYRTLLAHYAPHQILVLQLAPVDEKKQLYRTNRLAGYYNELIQQKTAEYRVDTLDVAALFAGSELPLEELLAGSMDDGLHFGSAAYELLADAIYSWLAS